MKLQDLFNKWNGELVCHEIRKLEEQIGNIKYATADYGSDIKKGLRLSGIAHIHDFSHLVALILEKMYSKDIRYQSLKSEMGRMWSKFIQTNIAAAVPPAGRYSKLSHLRAAPCILVVRNYK